MHGAEPTNSGIDEATLPGRTSVAGVPPRMHDLELAGRTRQRVFAQVPCRALQAWEIDHVIAWALTRDDGDDNLRPAHVKCHRRKTHKSDRPAISKTLRMAAKHRSEWPKPVGNARLPSRPFQSTRPLPCRQG